MRGPKAAQAKEGAEANKRVCLRVERQLSRTRIEMSHLVRSIDFHPAEKKRLIDKLRHTVEQLHCLERE